MEKLKDPRSQIAYATQRRKFGFVKQITGEPVIIKDDLFSQLVSLVHAQHSVSFFAINDAVKKLIEGGFLNFYWTKYEEWVKRKEYSPDSGPKVFTMDELSIGFIIWIGCLVICVAVFVLELFTFRLQLIFLQIKAKLFRITTNN